MTNLIPILFSFICGAFIALVVRKFTTKIMNRLEALPLAVRVALASLLLFLGSGLVEALLLDSGLWLSLAFSTGFVLAISFSEFIFRDPGKKL